MPGKKDYQIAGKIFGYLTVLDRVGCDKHGHSLWKCLCRCGVIKVVYGTHLVSRKTKSCGCLIFKSGKDHHQWTGIGDISGSKWSSYYTQQCRRKSRKNIEFSISKEYAWDVFIKQNRKCALSGVDLYFPKKNGEKGTASLDRIDNTKGYIIGNIQWVHKHINKMKNIHTQEYFIEMCKNVSEYNKD